MNAQIKQYLDDQSASITFFAKRSMDTSIENDDLKKEVKKLRKALREQKLRMQEGYKNGYESETVFWTRCIYEIDETLKEGE